MSGSLGPENQPFPVLEPLFRSSCQQEPPEKCQEGQERGRTPAHGAHPLSCGLAGSLSVPTPARALPLLSLWSEDPQKHPVADEGESWGTA